MSDCTYKLTLPSGEVKTIVGKAAMKAYLVQEGMATFFPDGFKADAAPGEGSGYASEVAQAQPAVSDSLNKSRSIDKKSVLTPSGAIKAEARNSEADSAVWYHQGDIKMLAFTANVTMDGQPAEGAERAKAIIQRVSAAQKAGWALRSYRAGSLGTVWTLEKGDRFLTRAGLENLDSSLTKDPEIPNYGAGYENMLRGQKELATALFNWLSTLTPEQRANQGVVSRKMADVLGGWAYVEKDKLGIHVRYRPSKESGKASVVQWTHTISAAKDWDGALVNIENLAGSKFPDQAAAQNTLAPASKTAELQSDTPAIDAHTATMDAVRAGTTTPEQFKASFEAVVSGADAIKAELNGKTKAELLRGGGPYFQARYKNEAKPTVIDGIYRAMLDEYTLGESFSYGMGSYEKAVRRLVEATDADKLTRFAEERAAAIQEAAARRQAKTAALENPQTLSDYRELLSSKIRSGMTRKEAFLTLTPEQRIQYDTLEAESTREAREARKRAGATRVQTAGQTTTGQVIATKHTKNGYDLFVVQLADRLSPEDYKKVLASAKKMGGWYSSFRGNGAIAGFQFKDRANADAFLQLAQGDASAVQAQVEQRRDAFEDDRSQTVVERLSAMADKLEAAAIEEENRDRKANTGRRARFARAALDAAAADKALAKTMRNIAQAIGDGRAKFLDQVRAKTQVDMLNQLVRTAKDNELRAKYPSYADQEKRKGEPPTAETADFAEFPTYGAFRSDLATLGRQLLEVDGTKKLGQSLMSVADDVTDAYLEFAKANLSLVSSFTRGDALADFANREAAERAIRKSGLSGKAIVLPIKRGQNRIVMSPSEAINRGIWQGDGDKRIMLTAEFGAELVEAIGRRGNKQNRLTVPWQFQNAYDRRKALSRLGIETPSEFRSALREFIGLKEQATQNKVRELELQMVGRKADGLDFFPTASEIADQMIEAADLTPDMAVLEPSAGMGHLADRIRAAGAEPDVIEISPDRRELLEEKGYHLADVDDFLSLKPRETFTYGDVFRAPDGTEGILRGSNQNRVRLVDEDGNQLGFYNRDELTGVRHRGTGSGYDRIIMNPPFSNRRDAQHVRHAYGLLKPGGRIVAIMGEGVFFGNDQKAQDFRDWLESVGGTSEKLPEGSFMDPSLPVTTGVNARMVIIDKPDVAPGEVASDSSDIAFSRKDESPLAQEVREAAAALDAANEMGGAMDRADPDTITLEDFMAAGEARMNAEKAMVEALAKAPDDGFAVEGLTPDGRMLVVTPSASEPGRWQLTRFGRDGEPWGDTRFNTKEMALKYMVEEAIPSSLRHVDAAFSRGTGNAYAGVNWVESADQSAATIVANAIRADNQNKPGTYAYTIVEPDRGRLGAGFGNSGSARAQNLTDALSRQAREFGATFGRRVVFVRPDRGSPSFFNGFILAKSDPNTIYVNIDANVNLMSILGHEFYEGLLVQNPKLHNWFVNESLRHMKDGALAAYVDKIKRSGDKQSDAGRLKELLADFTGDALADPEFRRSLEQTDQSKFRQLIRAFRNFLIQTLSKMRARVTGSGLTGDKALGSEQYFKDVQALRDVLRKVIQQSNSGGNLKTYLENGGAMFSRGAESQKVVDDAETASELRQEGLDTRVQTASGKTWAFDRFAEAGIQKGSATQAMKDAVSLTGLDLGLKVEISDDLPDAVPMSYDHQADVVYVNRTFAHSPRWQMAQWMAEEVLHALDSARPGRMLSANAAAFDFNSGSIANEVAEHFAANGPLSDWLAYPLAQKSMTQSVVKAELFARLGVIYFGQPKLLRRHLPKAYEAYHETFNLGSLTGGGDADQSLSAEVHRARNPVWNPKAGGRYGNDPQAQRGDAESRGERSADPGLERLYSKLRKNFGASRLGGIVQFSQSLTRSTNKATAQDFKANGDFDPANPDIRYSRKFSEVKDQAMQSISKVMDHPGELHWWHKTVGTMNNLAERSPAFKRVFNAAQGFLDDVSHYATDAADMAPKLLPQLESIMDVTKRPISAEDNRAIQAPIFEGTLAWARDRDGAPVLVEDLEAVAATLTADQKAQELLRNNAIDPRVLRAWRGLPLEKYERFVSARYASKLMAPGIVWTDSELRTMFSLNDGQIELYREFRDATDRSLDNMARADMLRFGGEDLKPLKKKVMEAAGAREAVRIIGDYLKEVAQAIPSREGQMMKIMKGVNDRYDRLKSLQDKGYAPLMRFGEYTVDVVVDGERKYFSMFESKADSNAMYEKMVQEYGQDAVTQGAVSKQEHLLMQGINPETLELFGNMLGLESDGDTARDLVFQEYLRKAKSSRSAMKRLIHRKGIAGYSQDVGRVLASFVYSNARQTAAGLNMGELGEAVAVIPKGQGQLRDAASALAEYVKNPKEEGQAIRGLLFAQYLGCSVASASLNMLQPTQVTFPWLTQFTSVKNAAGQLAKAAKNMASKGYEYEADLAKALKAAEDDGTVSPQEVHQLMRQAGGGGSMRVKDGTRMGDLRAEVANKWEVLKFGWGSLFGAAEQINRRMTFIAAYRIAKENDLSNPEAFARKAVVETQFAYTKANKPKWARSAIGGTLFTFKTFSISYLELMHRMWNAGTPGSPERAAGRRAVGIMMVMLLLLSGMSGLPFAEDAEDLATAAGQMMGYNFDAKQKRNEFIRSMLGSQMADFLDRGFSGIPGVPLDVSGRLGLGNLIPGSGVFKNTSREFEDFFELLGPVGSLARDSVKGLKLAFSGNVTSGLAQVSPVAARNLIKGADMAAMGMYRDQKGYKVLDTTMLEAALKSIGFQPSSVAKEQDKTAAVKQAIDYYNLKAAEIRSLWAAGIFERDPDKVQQARDTIAAWNAKNPDLPMRVYMPSVAKRVREMAKPRSERVVGTAPQILRQSFRDRVEEVEEVD